MKSVFSKVLLGLAAVFVLGMVYSCVYGDYEPNMWAADSPITQAYTGGGGDDDDSATDSDSNTGDDDDNDNDNDDTDKDFHPTRHHRTR